MYLLHNSSLWDCHTEEKIGIISSKKQIFMFSRIIPSQVSQESKENWGHLPNRCSHSHKHISNLTDVFLVKETRLFYNCVEYCKQLCQVGMGYSCGGKGAVTLIHSFLHSTHICEEVSVRPALFILGAKDAASIRQTDVTPQRLRILQGHTDRKHIITIRCKQLGRESMMTIYSSGAKCSSKKRI